MRLELSRRAQNDLDDIYDYSLQTFGLPRATAYLESIEQVFRRILSFPEIGGVHLSARPPIRSLPCEQHRIFYDVSEDRVIVQRILHKAIDVEFHLQVRD